jgi:hypothetical protein
MRRVPREQGGYVMRSTLRIAIPVVVMVALLLPLTAFASGGPCPDDPVGSKNCYDQTPPWFVVINRSVEEFDRPGTGCQPIILKHPEYKDCTAAEQIDIEAEVCQYLPAAAGDTLYTLCCDHDTNPGGCWSYRTYTLDGAGGCTLDGAAWLAGLPPGTGIDLPAPVIIGGLVLLAAILVMAGVMVRRRALQAA